MRRLCPLFLVILLAYPVFGQNTRTRQTAIALINFLGTQAALIQKYQEDSPTLEDIYNRIENDTQPYVFGSESTRTQIRNLFNNITEFQNYDLRRDRIRAVRDNAKARAISQAIPSPVFFLSLASNIRNPLALVINIAGMAAQSATSYMSATEQADVNAYLDFSKLTEQQKTQVNNLRTYMYDYMSRTAREFDLNEDYDTVSRAAITDFINNTTNPNLQLKLAFLSQRQTTYQNYYPYWLDLANTYFDLERYGDCLASIQRFEAIRVNIFRPNCDYDYAQTLTRGIIALSNVYSGEDYRRRCLDFLGKIEVNAPFTEWSIRYAAALAYLDLASKFPSERRTLLNSAYQLLKGNMVNLITGEQETVKRYIEPLVQPPRNAIKGQMDAYDRANRARRTELPPFNYALYANFYALHGVMEQLNIPESERREIAAMTRGVFLIPDFRVTYFNEDPGEAYYNYLSGLTNNPFSYSLMAEYFRSAAFYLRNDYIRFSITRPLIGNSRLNLSLPALFFWSGSSFSIKIERIDLYREKIFRYEKTQILNIENLTPEINNVNRPSLASYSGSNDLYLGRYRVDAEFDLRQRVNLDRRQDYLVTITIDNSGPLAVLRFRSIYDSLNFLPTFPTMYAWSSDGASVETIGVEDAIKALTDKATPRVVWGPEKNPVMAGILTELDKYLVSNNFRPIPSGNRTVSLEETENYLNYYGNLGLLKNMVTGTLKYDSTKEIGIYLDTSPDGRTTTIIIIHSDNRVEFRYYEK